MGGKCLLQKRWLGQSQCPPESTRARDTALGAFWRKQLEQRALGDAPAGPSSEALQVRFMEVV